MSSPDTHRPQDEDIETALLDADLFVKYKVPERAIARLRSAVERYPRSLSLREKLREVAAANKQPGEAARQCLALASLYIAREEYETAHKRLLEAKKLDSRISLASGLDAIRRARHHPPGPLERYAPSAEEHARTAAKTAAARPPITLAGDLSAVSVFDTIQVIENSRLTGILSIRGARRQGQIFFNEGRIAGAKSGSAEALDAFRLIIEITSGTFDFKKSSAEFPATITAASNTNLILNTLRQLDEENS